MLDIGFGTATLTTKLYENGCVIYGQDFSSRMIELAFGNRDELEVCKEDSGDEWDDDEVYCVADDLKQVFPNLEFEKMTFCSGILILSR